MQAINYNTALPYRVTVKMPNGNLNEWYTIYANDLDQATKISETKFNVEKQTYGFTIQI